MDICRVRFHIDSPACAGLCVGVINIFRLEVVILPIVIATAGTALANFAEGAILAASVYLVSRGVRNPLKTKK